MKQVWVVWTRQFILASDTQYPRKMGGPGVSSGFSPSVWWIGACLRVRRTRHSLGKWVPAPWGARILATAAKLLKEKGKGRALISICTADGVGVVAIVER